MAKSKRRSKNSAPNIPKETLERARRQLEGTDDIEDNADTEVSDEVIETSLEEKKISKPVAEITRSKRISERRSTRYRSSASSDVMQFSQREKRKKDVLDHEKIEEMLAHPTIFVTEEELHAEYGFVLRDLRNMGILVAGLMVFLVVLAQFI